MAQSEKARKSAKRVGREGTIPVQRGSSYEDVAFQSRRARDLLTGEERPEYQAALGQIGLKSGFIGTDSKLFAREHMIEREKSAREQGARLRDIAARRAFIEFQKEGTQFSKPWMRKAKGGKLLEEEEVESGLAGLVDFGGKISDVKQTVEELGVDEAEKAIAGKYKMEGRSVDFGRAFNRQMEQIEAGKMPEDVRSPIAKRNRPWKQYPVYRYGEFRSPGTAGHPKDPTRAYLGLGGAGGTPGYFTYS